MSLKVTYAIDDADLEAGIAQARLAYNASLPEDGAPIDDDAAYAAFLSAAGMEAFRGSAKRSLAAKIEQLKAEDISDVVAVVDAKIAAAAIEVTPLADPVVEIKP